MPRDVSLRDHVDSRLDALERHVDSRIDALEKYLVTRIEAVDVASATANGMAKQAVDKAEVAVERRLEGLNELRGLVSDYQKTLLPRTEADTWFTSFREDLNKLEKAQTARTGRSAGLAAGWAYLIAAVGLLSVIAGVLIAALN